MSKNKHIKPYSEARYLLPYNNQFKASVDGTIAAIEALDAGGYEVSITTDEDTVVDTIPAGAELLVSEGQTVVAGEVLTTNPNVGGFGQKDAEVVLQSPARIGGLMAFIGGVMLCQALLVIKKKQVEKVQAAEMEF